MKIGNIESITNALPVSNSTKEEDFSFGSLLNEQLQNVKDLEIKSDELSEKMVAGEVQDIHKVMIATEEAQIALQLTVQIRNKVIEAYQEVSRMQL
ncbi:flagellar hook-basal body complex protein FliE [Clostridium sp. DL1XJH146]